MKYLYWLSAMIIVAICGCKKEQKHTVAVLSTTSATGITATSAMVGGTITNNGGSTITKSGVCWATHSTPTLSDSFSADGSTMGAFSATLENLNANTTYYVCAFAINATGTAYGNVDSFTTVAGLATISTTAISNIAPLTAHSGGTITNSGGTAITARGIVWSTSPHPTTANFKTSDSSGVGMFQDSMTYLASQTTYYVRAYATNTAGTSYGNEISFTAASANTVVDYDGNVYPYVMLGTQSWMAGNLRTTHYQNGDPIDNGSGAAYNWSTTTSGAYTYPNGDSGNNATMGKLYNVLAVADTRNACPMGWHVPSDGEWQTLEFYEGMTPADTGTQNNGPRGTIGAAFLAGGSTGLNLPNAGILSPSSGKFFYFNTRGYYLTSTLATSYGAYYYRAFNTVSGNPGPIYRQYANYAMSVRCVKN